jgi:hypothetical protein
MDKELPKKVVKQKEEPEVEKVVNPKRVVIATVIGVVIAGLVLWMLSQLAQKIIDFTTAPVVVSRNNTPTTTVDLPEIGDAKNIGELHFSEFFATGSATRNMLDTLQNLQQSEVGIEDYFCKFFCN